MDFGHDIPMCLFFLVINVHQLSPSPDPSTPSIEWIKKAIVPVPVGSLQRHTYMGGAPLAVGSGMDQSHVTSHVTMVNIKIAGICGKMWVNGCSSSFIPKVWCFDHTRCIDLASLIPTVFCCSSANKREAGGGSGLDCWIAKMRRIEKFESKSVLDFDLDPNVKRPAWGGKGFHGSSVS